MFLTYSKFKSQILNLAEIQKPNKVSV